MALFELENGRLVPAQFGRDVPDGFTDTVLSVVRSQVLEIVSRPLFPIYWSNADIEEQHAIGSRLTALDASGQVVAVEVMRMLDADALIDSLSRLADTASLSWSDLANRYPLGPEGFRREWVNFREAMPPSPPNGPRLILVTSKITDEVRPALDVLSSSGVEVHQMSLRQMSNGRAFLEVEAVGPRLYGHRASTLLETSAVLPALGAGKQGGDEGARRQSRITRSSQGGSATAELPGGQSEAGHADVPHSHHAQHAPVASPVAATPHGVLGGPVPEASPHTEPGSLHGAADKPAPTALSHPEFAGLRGGAASASVFASAPEATSEPMPHPEASGLHGAGSAPTAEPDQGAPATVEPSYDDRWAAPATEPAPEPQHTPPVAAPQATVPQATAAPEASATGTPQPFPRRRSRASSGITTALPPRRVRSHSAATEGGIAWHPVAEAAPAPELQRMTQFSALADAAAQPAPTPVAGVPHAAAESPAAGSFESSEPDVAPPAVSEPAPGPSTPEPVQAPEAPVSTPPQVTETSQQPVPFVPPPLPSRRQMRATGGPVESRRSRMRPGIPLASRSERHREPGTGTAPHGLPRAGEPVGAEGLVAIAQAAGADVAVFLRSAERTPEGATLSLEGVIVVPSGRYDDPTAALRAEGIWGSDGWESWRIGDPAGPTLAEALAELRA